MTTLPSTLDLLATLHAYRDALRASLARYPGDLDTTPALAAVEAHLLADGGPVTEAEELAALQATVSGAGPL